MLRHADPSIPVMHPRIHRGVWLIPAVLVGVYLAGALLIFDFSSYAQDCCEETYQGKTVAYGPRPRWPFDDPYGRNSYTAREWVLQLYRPMCDLWRGMNGYVAPSAWRTAQ